MADNEPEYRRRIRQKAEQDERQTKREGDKAAEDSNADKVVGAIKGLTEKIDSQANEDPPHKKRERRWQHAEVLGLWAAAAVGVIAICVANSDASKQVSAIAGQQLVMQGQLNEMRAEERPWVSLGNTGEHPTIERTQPLAFDARGGIMTIFAHFRNTGKDPAIGVRWHARLIPLLRNKLEIEEVKNALSRYCDPLRKQPYEILEKTIFPGDFATEGQDVQLYPKDITAALAARQRGIFAHPGFISAGLIMCFDYRDSSNQHHQTRYGFDLGIPTPVENGFTGMYQGDFQPTGVRPEIRIVGPLYETAD